MKIPKIIHQVWIGPNKPPEFLGSWKEMNPGFEWLLWDIKAVKNFLPLYNQHLFDEFASQRTQTGITGIVDLLRYEILYKYGGIYIDADVECLRPLEGEFLESSFFISYVLDQVEDILSTSVIGCVPEHTIMNNIIEELYQYEKVEDTPNIFTGSCKLTKVIEGSGVKVTKLPSYCFNPIHYSGAKYMGDFKPFGDHKWNTARKVFKSS